MNFSNESRYDLAADISALIWQWTGSIVIVFGILGNLFLMIILSNKNHRRDPTAFYFVAIGGCELVFLFGSFSR